MAGSGGSLLRWTLTNNIIFSMNLKDSPLSAVNVVSGDDKIMSSQDR